MQFRALSISIARSILLFFRYSLYFFLFWCFGVLAFAAFQTYQGTSLFSRGMQDLLFDGVPDTEIVSKDSQLARKTTNTFLSIPEWYIVFISSDFATWLEQGKKPADFPYMSYLRDYWEMYGRIRSILDKKFPHDSEYHTMVQVIGLSTTLELSVKYFYESTLGTLFSYFGDAPQEDALYAEFQRAYVQFILLRPWYEFPFHDWIEKLSQIQENGISLRAKERKNIYSLEFHLKKYYASWIGSQTRELYTLPSTVTGVMGSFPKTLPLPQNVYFGSGGIILPRYHPFTELYPQLLLKASFSGETIAGNKRFVYSLLSPQKPENTLFSYPVHIAPENYRAFFYSDSQALAQQLRDASILPYVSWPGNPLKDALVSESKKVSHQSLEHLYDF